ncbi:MAG: ATP-binding protein [Spirochaetia bacterium]|jgi:AAA+ ATPase superfamily predicted ATPase|nr:ATP-binding protein [Spirochaetia bacterium]
MFCERTDELKKLQELYESKKFELAIIYGRRRVGKTTLIREFCKDKEAIYYLSIDATRQGNLEALSKEIQSYLYPGETLETYKDFETILSRIDKLSERKLIVAIDEYPYLAKSYPPISSMIQKHIDLKWKSGRMLLILCGSSMSFMEHQLLGYQSPLYGRRTAQFKIQPFTFFQSRSMLEGFSSQDQALLYAITGGIPEYLSALDLKKSTDDNIYNLFFDSNGRLVEEPHNLLLQELRHPGNYFTVLTALSNGASRLNEIATAAHISTSSCTNQLKSLEELHLIKKCYPFKESGQAKKSIYRFEDQMFRFWYRFVMPNQSLIAMGNGMKFYQDHIKEQLAQFMEPVFESICMQYLWQPKVYAGLEIKFKQLSSWWGTNPNTKQQEEIDIIGTDGKALLVAECKWKNDPADKGVLATLRRRASLFPQQHKILMIFSKTGFTTDLQDEANKKKDVRLVSFEEMCQKTILQPV